MLARILEAAASASSRRPGAVFALAAAAAALSLLSVSRLELDEDLTALLPSSVPELKGLDAVRETVGGMDYAVAVIESREPDPGLLSRASEILGRRLLERPDLVRRVKTGIDPEERKFFADFFLKHAFQYLNAGELDEALRIMSREGMRKALAEDARLLDSPLPNAIKEKIERDPLGLFEKVFQKRLLAGFSAFSVDFRTGMFVSSDGRAALLQAFGTGTPRDAGFSSAFMSHFRSSSEAALGELGLPDGTLWIGCTGGFPVAEASRTEIRRDMVLTAASSFACVLALFYLAYRAARVNVIAGLPLALGVLYSFGICPVLLGFRMTAVAAAFASILFGLGIDYPLHLYNRFAEERRAGYGCAEALARTWRNTAKGAVYAGATTSAAFAVLCFAKFRGLLEVGLLTAIGVAVIGVAMILLLPALIAVFEARKPAPPGFSFGVPALAAAIGRRPGIAAGTCLAVLAASAVLLAVSGLPRFETDFSALKSPMPEIDRANSAIEARFGMNLNPLLVVSRGADRKEALTKAAEAGAVLAGAATPGAVVAGPGSYMPSREGSKAAAARLSRDLDPAQVGKALHEELDAAGFDPEAFRETSSTLVESLEVSSGRPADLDAIEAAGYGGILNAFAARTESGWAAVTVVYAPGSSTQASRAAEAARLGAALLEAGDAETVVTGMDVLILKIRDLIAAEFFPLTAVSALLVAGLAFAHFLDLRKVALALIPVCAGFAVTLACMKVLGINLNFMNIIVLPMIFGMGVDDGIHFISRLSERGSGGPIEALLGTGKPIMLTSLTTMAGFGSLVAANNPGLRSIGAVALLGVFICLVFSTILLPSLIILGRKLRGRPVA